MNLKEIGAEMLSVAKPGLKVIAKDVIEKVVITKLVDPLIDKVKKLIPGTWDDMILEGAKPKIKEALVKLVAKL